jgi:hypothetical protein
VAAVVAQLLQALLEVTVAQVVALLQGHHHSAQELLVKAIMEVKVVFLEAIVAVVVVALVQ